MSEETKTTGSVVNSVFKLADTTTKKLLILVALLGAIGSLVVKWQQFSAMIFPEDTDEYVEIVLDTSENMDEEFDDGKSKWDVAVQEVSLSARHYSKRKHTKFGLRDSGGDCNDFENSRQLMDFGNATDEKVDSIKKIRIGGEADLRNALTHAITDFENAKRFRSDKLRNTLIVIMGGASCGSLNLDQVKTEMEKKKLGSEFRLICMSPDDAAWKQLKIVAESLGGVAVQVTDGSELRDAVSPHSRDEILTMSQTNELWNSAWKLYKNKEDDKALVLLLQLAEKNHAKSMLYAGRIYSDIDGPKRDFSKALHWFEKAWNAGNVPAGFELGANWEDPGRGAPPPDLQKALIWYTKAADKGHPKAMKKMKQLQQLAANPS